VFFDDEHLYVSARCLDSQPDRIAANELRRDGSAISQNDNFGIVLDTFLDRRNQYYFQTTPIGALRDASVTDGVNNANWSTVWDVRSRWRFRSSRSATGAAARRHGASTPGGKCNGRTSRPW
jgi:hypothetical protein